MLTRQRILLSFIDRGGRALTRTQLMKWLFLLRHEEPDAAGQSFYEFVPYRYGPFSFQIYRELSAMESSGVLLPGELRIDGTRRGDVKAEIRVLPAETASGVDRVIEKYRPLSLDDLLDDVYERYPWYASRSERRPARRPEPAPLAVYTVGYEGRTVDGLLDHLLRSGVRRIVDVRKNALSRKYGFSGRTLAKLSADLDVEYAHVPSVGIPSSLRVDLDSPEAYQRLFDHYEREILPDAADGISQVSGLCGETPSVLMCLEASPQECHRGRLAPYVARESHLAVKHL